MNSGSLKMASNYTFIFGKSLTPYHTQSLYKDRFVRDENNIGFIQVLDILNDQLNLMIQQTTVDLPPDVDSTIAQIHDVIKRIKDDPDNKSLITEFRQYLETVTYLGYGLYLFEMNDVKTDEIPEGVEAYLYDTNDDLVPEVANIAKAWVVNYQNQGDANISNVAMQFYKDLVGINNFTASVIHLNSLIDQFDKLNEIGDGYMFDVSGLLRFLEGSGYKIQIVL